MIEGVTIFVASAGALVIGLWVIEFKARKQIQRDYDKKLAELLEDWSQKYR